MNTTHLIYDKNKDSDWILITKETPIPIKGWTNLKNFLTDTNMINGNLTFTEWKKRMKKSFGDCSSIVFSAAVSLERNTILLISIDKITFDVFGYKEVSIPSFINGEPKHEKTIERDNEPIQKNKKKKVLER